MLDDIFTSGQFWFWTLVIVQSGLIIWFVETGGLVGAGVSLVALVGGLLIVVAAFPGDWLWFDLNQVAASGFWEWCRGHVWGLLAVVGSYGLIGVAWATFRWWLYVRDLRDRYERTKIEWLTPGRLRRTASQLDARASGSQEDSDRLRFSQWANICREAAATGGSLLTRELKPVWKDHLEHEFHV